MTASAVLSSIALKKVIKTPSAVANALDWRKASGGVATALTIDVHADKIGLALATLTSDENDDSMNASMENSTFTMLNTSRRQQLFRGHDLCLDRDHFSLGHRFSCKALEPIPLIPSADHIGDKIDMKIGKGGRKRKRVVSAEAKLRLSGLVKDHNVCGFVVSWPVQQDTGLMGASCGLTLWALEQILKEEDTEGGVGGGDKTIVQSKTHAPSPFGPNRPLCLWQRVDNSNNNDRYQHPSADAFGRSSVYARTSTKTEHFASKEQYHLANEPIIAEEVWRDFYEHHWPAAPAVHTQNGEFGMIPIGGVQQHSHGNVNANNKGHNMPVTPVASRYSAKCLSALSRGTRVVA